MLPLSLQRLFIIVIVLQLGSANDVCEKRFDIKSSQLTCPPEEVGEGKTFKYYVFQDEEGEQCFPHCKPILKGMDVTPSCPKYPCPPAYNCIGTDLKKCVLDKSSCFKYHVDYSKKDEKYFKALWKPECLPDGKWAPKQCKGDKFTGRCFCYNALGKRIDGQQWYHKAENMTCACSRKRHEMMQEPTKSFISLHCDVEGNYEPLQCNNGQCWCAHPPTGKVMSKVVPENMMKFLPCYDAKMNGDQYLRQCESQLYAQKKIVHQLQTHGTTGFLFDSIRCDADGTYGIFTIAGNILSCVWKDNKPLGFTVELGANFDISQIDCHCARDLKYYEMAGRNPDDRGKCTGPGSYMPLQRKLLDDDTSRFYCVDKDGFQISPLVEKSADLGVECSNYLFD